MSENETQQTLPAAEIPEVQISESELEQVSGGSEGILDAIAKAVIDYIRPDVPLL